MNLSKYASPPTQPVSEVEHPRDSPSNPQLSTPSQIDPQLAASAPDGPFESSLDGNMDEFAQTRPPDDLFADDFEPIEEPATENVVVPETHTDPAPDTRPPQRGNRGRGRGSKRGNIQRASDTASNANATATGDEEKPAIVPALVKKEAVRGDRSGTGGVKKAKLTEEELSARMEEIKLKNQSLEAAHARAEADEAHFKEREAQAQEKRRLERLNRQHMMGEREKNRQRKLNALQGREWDAQKDETQAGLDGPSGRSQFRRGAYGGVTHDDRPTTDEPGRDNELNQPEFDSYGRGTNRGRGRGGRGRGRGRGGGLISSNTSQRSHPTEQQNAPDASDFPALPGKASNDTPTTVEPVHSNSNTESQEQPSEKGASWAEEMENQPTAWKS